MASDFPVTIHHNPNCGTSRNTLQLLRDRGHEPRVVEYSSPRSSSVHRWKVPRV